MPCPTLTADDELAAAEQLHELAATDGLPVIVPTPSRVESMVLAGGLDPHLVLGTVPPRQGIATVEAVATNAVMAGCLPDHFPVVLAAVRSVLEPAFDLAEVQVTTNCVFPVIIVNGPARAACGLASGFGAFGPGHRANATIGRALRLVLLSIGGASPGLGDMALLGFGKFGACIAEAEEESPFEPLSTALGFAEGTSTVTVSAVEPLQQVVCTPHSGKQSQWVDSIIGLLATSLASVTSPGAYGGNGAPVVILNPDHARLLHGAGYTRSSICEEIAARAASPRGRLRELNPELLRMFESRNGLAEVDRDIVPAYRAEKLLLIVAGGPGMYCFVMPHWGGGNHVVSVATEIEIGQACDIP